MPTADNLPNLRLVYISNDGTYGDATDLTLVDVTDFTSDDFDQLDAVPDRERGAEAGEIAAIRNADPIVFAWMTADEAEEAIAVLVHAIDLLIEDGRIGAAEQVGDVRDLLTRTGLGVTA
jgi:hypothetical protein